MRLLFQQFARFFLVGTLSALLQFFVLILCVEVFWFRPIPASATGYLAGALLNYYLNRSFAFQSMLPHRQALLRFSLNSFLGLILNLLIMQFVLNFYAYLISQVLTSGVILVWNFLIHRYWTFQLKSKVAKKKILSR